MTQLWVPRSSPPKRVGSYFAARLAFCPSEVVRARGYSIPQHSTDTNLTRYLAPIRDIEQQTGLDFLWGLEDTVEGPMETAQPSALWN